VRRLRSLARAAGELEDAGKPDLARSLHRELREGLEELAGLLEAPAAPPTSLERWRARRRP
jgi:hypothetical protein